MTKPHHDRIIAGELRVMAWLMGTSLLAYGLAIAFVALTGLFSKPQRPPQREPVRWMPPLSDDAAVTDLRYLLLDLCDPSLSTLPSRHGFSESMWREITQLTFRSSAFRVSEAMLPWAPPPAFECIAAQPTAVDTTVDSATKQTETPVLVAVAEDAVPAPSTNTAFRLIGPLASRPMLHPPSLPSIASDIPLRPTRFLVGANALGQVCYTLLERSSGSQSADDKAAAAIENMQFTPQDTQGQTWGTLYVLWAIEDTAAPVPAPAPPPADNP